MIKMNTPAYHLYRGYARIRRVFSLNDGRWGRGEGDPPPNSSQEDPKPQPRRPASSPPDLDELWRDLNQKLGRLFGNRGPGRRGPGGFPPPGGFKNAGIGVGVVSAVLLVLWLGSGFFIIQEGQQAVITQFGKYHSTVGAGFNWRLPWPVQNHESVFVSQIRSLDIGRDAVVQATGLRESAMLTADENIVEIKFAVQYRLTDARAYLFETRNPTDAVIQAAESAVREVVGAMKMDAALSEDRDQIAPQVRSIMQKILDHYQVGIEVVAVNLQQGGIRPPEQVQAAFDDVLKAGQERERTKNEAEAYANDVVPRAAGAAARLNEEALAYKERVVAQAQGDAHRFKAVLSEYQKSPQVTRDRIYLDTMQQIYSNVTKVLVDNRQGSNLLYLPLDKIMQMSGNSSTPGSVGSLLELQSDSNKSAPPPPAAAVNDSRARTDGRLRDRDSR